MTSSKPPAEPPAADPAPEDAAPLAATMPSAQEQTTVWLLEGIRPNDIVQALEASYPQADPAALIDRAVAIFRATADADTTVIRGWCLEAYRELYRRMVAIGDFAGALRAVQSLLKYADSHASPEPDEPPPPGPEEAPAKPKRLTRKPSVAR